VTVKQLDLSAEQIQVALAQRREAEAIREDATACVASLRQFVEAAWPLVEPATLFAANWHIDAICDYLQAASRGEIRRLLINVPPRHMKSLAVSVFWPAWWWTFAPHIRFLSASYGASLAERDAIKSRDLLRSRWYRERWPGLELKGDVNRTSRYENSASGYRIATSVGGEATGEGGDVIIIDDPHKTEEALSATARARVIDWHDGTLGFRFNDPKTGVEVVVMQRLHEQDLAGHLLERSGWTHLCLPARYEPAHPFVWPADPRTEVGELLWPAHVPEPELKRIEETMGSFRVAGQLQQRPAAQEGELLKRAWWRFYEPNLLNDDQLDRLPRFQQIIASWDTAFKDTTTSDYVVGQVWGIHGADRYLLYSYRQKASLQQTKDAMRAAHTWVEQRWPRIPHRILIEKSANGVEIIAELQRELPGVLPITVTADKTTRAMAASPPLEAGNIHLPGRAVPGSASGYQAADWVAQLIEEAASFPNGRHDDQIDAYSQAINYARTHPAPRPARSIVPRARILTDATKRIPSYHHDSRNWNTDRLATLRTTNTPEGLAAYLGIPYTGAG
jgi:predicted phage terminase large subunit-like protein